MSLLAPEGPGSFGWYEYLAEFRGEDFDSSPISRGITESTTGAVTEENGKNTTHIIDMYELDRNYKDRDLSKGTSVTTRIPTVADDIDGMPDFVMLVEYYDNAVPDEEADFELIFEINGDATLANSLHDELCRACFGQEDTLAAIKSFVKEHKLPNRHFIEGNIIPNNPEEPYTVDGVTLPNFGDMDIY